MAIQFARAQFISRSKGGNAVRSAAYAMRDSLYDERTGQRFTFRDGGSLQYHEILLPAGANSKFTDPYILWNAVEAAENRRNSQVAREVVLALPSDLIVTNDDRVALAVSFAKEHFVNQGLPVQLNIHGPHSAQTQSETCNYHCHLLIGTRRLDEDGFSRLKANDGQIRSINGRPIVIEAERWGEIWKVHQDDWFSANGKSITVDPIAPIPGQHLGPKRFQHPRDPRLETAEHVRQLNAKIARDPDAVAQHLGRHPFDALALSRFLSKHIVDPKERDEVQAEVHDKINQLKRAALEKASWSDKVQSGLRPLSVEDIARELSPAYAALVSKANDLREAARKAEWIQNRQAADKEAGQHRVAERWAEMGVARRLMHLTGAWGDVKFQWRDAEIDRWSNLAKRGEYGEAKYAIRVASVSGGKLGAPTGEIQVIARRAEIELDKMRPSGLSLRQEAELELRQRRRIAENARAALETLNLSDRRALRASRSR